MWVIFLWPCFLLPVDLKKKKKKKLYLWMRMRVSYIITALQVLSYQFIHNDVHALAGVFEVDSWMIGTKRKRKRII